MGFGRQLQGEGDNSTLGKNRTFQEILVISSKESCKGHGLISGQKEPEREEAGYEGALASLTVTQQHIGVYLALCPCLLSYSAADFQALKFCASLSLPTYLHSPSSESLAWAFRAYSWQSSHLFCSYFPLTLPNITLLPSEQQVLWTRALCQQHTSMPPLCHLLCSTCASHRSCPLCWPGNSHQSPSNFSYSLLHSVPFLRSHLVAFSVPDLESA